MITDAVMIIGSGLLGSAHCIGMCGPIVVTLGASAPSPRANVLRQLIYTLGRVSTYSFLGAVSGFAGFWLLEEMGAGLRQLQATLAILAGSLLIFQGLLTAGWVRLPGKPTSQAGCLTASFFQQVLKTRGLQGAFLAGLATGFLPCGLVYAFLALAASSGSLLAGIAIMFCFGIGTFPLMLMTGCGGALLSVAFRRRLLAVAALCVLLMGATTVARGAAFFFAPAQSVSCPFCLDG